MKFDCTIYDACEGKLQLTVEAADEDHADEEAGIAAAEHGCQHVKEVVIGTCAQQVSDRPALTWKGQPS